MKKLLLIFITGFILFGCKTPAELVQKALKKDPNIINCDSTIVTKYIDTTKTLAFDSLIIDNKDIYLKVVGSGKISLDYKIKSQTIPVITPHDSNSQTRQKERTNRVEIKYDYRLEVKKLKHQLDSLRNENKKINRLSNNALKKERFNLKNKLAIEKVKSKESVKKERIAKRNWLLVFYILGCLTAILIRLLIKRFL